MRLKKIQVPIGPPRSDNFLMGWKLFRRRKNGTIGPLFINRRLVITVGDWNEAQDHKTPGYAHRPGWHACLKPIAPHLKQGGDRVWCRVELQGCQLYKRPESQGGEWVLAKRMRVVEVCG